MYMLFKQPNMISNMTRNIPRVMNGVKSKPIQRQSFKRETKFVKANKSELHTSVQPPDASSDLLGEPREKCAMEETRDVYRRSMNKRWNHWAMTDLDPLPRRTVVNKFKKNKGLLFKHGTKYETSKVNKRAMHLAVQRERAYKYEETPFDLQEERLCEEEDAYLSTVPSLYAYKWVSEIEENLMKDAYNCGENWFEEYWYAAYHELPPYVYIR